MNVLLFHYLPQFLPPNGTYFFPKFARPSGKNASSILRIMQVRWNKFAVENGLGLIILNFNQIIMERLDNIFSNDMTDIFYLMLSKISFLEFEPESFFSSSKQVFYMLNILRKGWGRKGISSLYLSYLIWE